jgi:hypothetical protein
VRQPPRSSPGAGGLEAGDRAVVAFVRGRGDELLLRRLRLRCSASGRRAAAGRGEQEYRPASHRVMLLVIGAGAATERKKAASIDHRSTLPSRCKTTQTARYCPESRGIEVLRNARSARNCWSIQGLRNPPPEPEVSLFSSLGGSSALLKMRGQAASCERVDC